MAYSFAQGTGHEFEERGGFQLVGFALAVHKSEAVNGLLIDQYMGFAQICNFHFHGVL